MLVAIGQIAVALAAIIGLITLLYRQYWSPKAKRRRQDLETAKKAADELDPSGVTAGFNRLNRDK